MRRSKHERRAIRLHLDAVYALAPEAERLTDGATSRMPTLYLPGPPP